MINAVIFDMDGLMVDTEPIQSESFEVVLREHGIEPRLNRYGIVQTIGVTALNNWERLREEYGLTTGLNELVARKRQVYTELLAGRIVPMPGLLDLIATLDEHQIRKAIASSSSLGHIGMVVSGLNIEQPFDVIASGEQVKRGKPHPDIFLRAAELLGLHPSECVVLEDAESGVKGAKAAGMHVVAVPNRFTQDHNFTRADTVVSSLGAVDWQLLSSF